MTTAPETTRDLAQTAALDFDAIIIGAGISGLYQLLRLREAGLKVRVFEAGTGVGGTWYWNRYPGCRFDSESYSYGYSFSQEVLDEWDWTEHFAPQPETERYLNYVTDKFDLRRDIQFSARVTAAHFDDDARAWDVTLEDGSTCRARYLVAAVGPLSAPTYPRIDGLGDFEGESYHTGLWPKHPVTFEGKRVAVIGTGATGVQTIQEDCQDGGAPDRVSTPPQLVQRRCRTGRSRQEEMEEIRGNYPDIFKRCQGNRCLLRSHNR